MASIALACPFRSRSFRYCRLTCRSGRRAWRQALGASLPLLARLATKGVAGFDREPVLGQLGQQPVLQPGPSRTVSDSHRKVSDRCLQFERTGILSPRGLVELRGYQHGTKPQQLVLRGGAVEIAAPRARSVSPEGEEREWQSRLLPRYRRAKPEVEQAVLFAAGLEEAGEELLTFYAFPPSQWLALRTTNAIERLQQEFRRRVKTQGALPNETAALHLMFGLFASGQIRLRRIKGFRDIEEEHKAAA
jgi:hypothetical protein